VRSAFRWWRLPVVLAAAVALLLPASAAASPESRALLRQGLADLKDRKFEEALKKFEAATRADPNDAEAFFAMGVPLNRLRRHAEALSALERARALGSTQPELPFETGWALLAARRFQDAATQLERYEAARPGRGQTSEFLGRAYLALGQADKAEARLKEALARDPNLKPTVLFYLAAVARAREDSRTAGARLEDLLREAPESPLARTLREQLARLVPPPPKPGRVTVSAGGGYNSNVIALGDGIPLPSDISSKRSGFSRFTLGAGYDWRLTAGDTLTAGYGFLADVYENVSGFDLLDHFFSVDYRHAFTRDLVATLRLSDELTLLGGDTFRNQVALRPALGYRPVYWAVLELGWSVAGNDYYFPTIPQQDRDSTTHTVSLLGFFRIPGTRLSGRLGYFHTWNLADGPDFDFETDGFQLGLGHPLPWRITADLLWTHTFDRYAHLNSLAGVTSFEFKRRDDTDAVNVQLGRPILNWLSAYLRYDFVNADSNIRFFTFHQHVVSGGFVASF